MQTIVNRIVLHKYFFTHTDRSARRTKYNKYFLKREEWDALLLVVCVFFPPTLEEGL